MSDSGYWARLQRRRLSRRRLLRAGAVAGVGVAGVAIAACSDGGGDGEPSPTAAGPPLDTGTPVRGGRYQAGIQFRFDTFDPHLSISLGLAFFPRVYNVLVHQSAVNPEFRVFDLAETTEHPDDVTYIFKIRPGVKVAPNTLGVPERDLDAEDAQVSFERIATEPGAGAGSFVKNELASWVARDPQTFVLETQEPYAWFWSSVGTYVVTIPPRELILNGVDLSAQGVGAGPFKLTRFDEDEGASLDRNPHYYRIDDRTGEQLPYIDGMDVHVLLDRLPRRSAFLSKQVYNYIAEDIDEANDLLAGNPDLYIAKEPSFTFIAFSMNPTRDPWRDDRIRRAASFALNRQQFIDLIAKGDARPNGIVHWPTGPYALPQEELETKYQPFDPAEARRLIGEATGRDTLRIKLIYPVLDPIPKYLSIFLEQYRAAGFEIQEDPQDFSTWLDNYRRVNYDASLSLNLPYETPQVPLNFHTSGGPAADGSFVVGIGSLYPEVDEVVEKAHRTTDPEALIEAVHDAQRLIYEKGPGFLPIYSGFQDTLYWNFLKNNPHLRELGVTYLILNDWWLEGAPN